MTVAEQESFLEYAKETDFYPLFMVGFSTGMRIGEILGPQWKDVDFTKNMICIVGTLIKVDGKEYHKGPTKTVSSNRVVPILPEISARLREWRKIKMEYRLMMGKHWEQVSGLEDLVFPTTVGRPLSRGVVFNSINRIIEVIKHDERMAADKERRNPVVFEHFCSHSTASLAAQTFY